MMRLIDADALIDALMTYTWRDDDERLIDDADEKREYIKQWLPDLQTVGGWVSVKGRLPEEKENPLTLDFSEVICFCDFGGIPKRTDIRTYGFGKRCCENEPHFWHGPQIMDGVVTHWMPLPEPPEEVNEDG